MALTKRKSGCRLKTCQCQIENILSRDKGLTTQDILTRMTPERSIMSTIRRSGLITGSPGNIKIILMITGIAIEITGTAGMPGTIASTGMHGVTGITRPVDRMVLTTCIGHILNTDINAYP